MLSGAAGGFAALLGRLGLGEQVTAATCKALGRACARNGECCSKTCLRPEGPDGRPRGGEGCLCRTTLKLPCGGRCCGPDQTCKRGLCVHHCRDGRVNFDESDRDCGGDDCPKCPLGFECDQPRDCQTGHCASLVVFNDGKSRCAECTADAHCGNTAKPFCYTVEGRPGFGGICSECATDAHCPDPATPICFGGTCSACITNEHCSAARPICNAETGQCIKCLSDTHYPDDRFCDDAGHCVAGEVCFDGLAVCRPGARCDCDLNAVPIICSCVS